ncbi:MAG TPA: amidohydrolase family protein [Azospirillum sp.]|nr:amidohydrolase family protein [Azospirillum sp.]
MTDAIPLPAGAVDAHAHVFGPMDRYPAVSERNYDPPPMPLERHLRLRASLGTARTVLVQPSVYGTDNRAMLDAMAEGGGSFRGVAVIDGSEPDADLAAMHAAGVRGVRINLLFRGGVPLDAAERIAARVAPLGWHMQFLVDVSATEGFAALVERLPVVCVVDHMGHVPIARGPDDAGFRALAGLLREGRCWVKLSGSYRMSRRTAAPYGDVRPYVDALLDANPDRLVWGSDWPHVGLAFPAPAPEQLRAELLDWLPDAGLRQRILADNPARLYDWSDAP